MGDSKIKLTSLVRLNTTSSGGEIYTKADVYVAYVNRLRYTVSLGGTVSAISAPTNPQPNLDNEPACRGPKYQHKTYGDKKKPGEAKAAQEYFNDFTNCYQHIWKQSPNFKARWQLRTPAE